MSSDVCVIFERLRSVILESFDNHLSIDIVQTWMQLDQELYRCAMTMKDVSGDTVWHKLAASDESLECLEKLWMRLGVVELDPREVLLGTNNEGDTIFHVASRRGRHEAVALFLGWARSSEVSVEVILRGKNLKGETPLYCCIQEQTEERAESESVLEKISELVLRDDIQWTQTLLEKSTEGKTLLQAACERGERKAVVNLLNNLFVRGIVDLESLLSATTLTERNLKDIILKKNQSGSNLLQMSCIQGHPDAFRVLMSKSIELGVDFEDIVMDLDEFGASLFCSASFRGQMDILKYIFSHVNEDKSKMKKILTHKETVNKKNMFTSAISRGHLEILKYLFGLCGECEVDLKDILFAEDSESSNAFHYFALFGFDGDCETFSYILKMAMEIGVDAREVFFAKQRKNNQNVFHMLSFQNDNVENLKHFVNICNQHDITIQEIMEEKNNYGENVIQVVALNGRNKMLNFLFEKLMESDYDVEPIILGETDMFNLSMISDKLDTFLIVLEWSKKIGLTFKKIFHTSNNYERTLLHCSAQKGCLEISKELIEISRREGLDIREVLLKVDKMGKNVFHLSAKSSLDLLDYFVQLVEEEGITLKKIITLLDYSGKNIFHHASLRGRVDVLNYGLEYARKEGMDILRIMEEKDKGGSNIFHLSTKEGHADFLRRLFALGEELGLGFEISSDIRDNIHQNIFQLATLSGHDAILKDLFDRAIRHNMDVGKILTQGNDKSSNLFETSIIKGHTEILEYLFQVSNRCGLGFFKITTDCNSYKSNLWHIASYFGQDRIVEHLFRTCDEHNIVMDEIFDQRDCNERNVFHVSSLKGNLGTLKIFFDRPALPIRDILASTESRGSDVFHLASFGGHVEVLSYLVGLAEAENIEFDQLAAACDANGETVFHKAALGGSVETLRLLFETAARHSMDTRAILASKNNRGNTVCRTAAFKEHFEALKYLLRIGKDVGLSLKDTVDDCSFRGSNLIHRIVSSGRDDILRDILEWASPDIDYKQRIIFWRKEDTLNAFQLAIDGGHVAALKLLFEHCQSIRLRFRDVYELCDRFGPNIFRTPFQKRHFVILGYLLECAHRETFDAAPIVSSLLNDEPNSLRALILEDQVEILKHMLDMLEGLSFQRLIDTHHLFHTASVNGCLKSLERLVERAKRESLDLEKILTTPNERGSNVFHLASIEGRVETLNFLILTAEEVGLTFEDIISNLNKHRCNIFHLSSMNGQVRTLKFLFRRAKEEELDIKPILMSTEDNGWDVFQLSVLNGHVPVVRWLLEFTQEADLSLLDVVRRETEPERNVFYMAMESGQVVILKHLFDAAADVLEEIVIEMRKNETASFHMASARGHIKTVDFLLEHCEKINIKTRDFIGECDGTGSNLVHVCSRQGRVDILKYIFGSLGSTDLKKVLMSEDREKSNAFQCATLNGQIKTLKYLLKVAQELEIKLEDVLEHQNESESNVFHHAFSQVNILKVLTEEVSRSGCDVGRAFLAKNEEGHNILECAVLSGNYEVFSCLTKTLEDTKSNVREVFESRGKDGLNLFALASHRKQVDILKNLFCLVQKEGLEVKDYLMDTDSENMNVFQRATANEDIDVLMCLLSNAKAMGISFKEAMGLKR